MPAATPPPEADLLKRKRGDLSIRQAARRAGVSDGTWRRIEGAAEIDRPAATVARMAAAVGATPAELAEAGRRDAAGSLEQIMAEMAAQPDVASATQDAAGPGSDAWAELMSEILQGLADIEASSLSGKTKAELRAELLSGLTRDAAERRRQIQSVRRLTGGR